MKSTITLTGSDAQQSNSTNPILSVTVFEPENTVPSANIVIASAFGVAQSFYWLFAEHLCELGYRVVCFDYSGTGENEANVSDPFQLAEWGSQDIEQVLSHALSQGLPVHFIGHSIGGQLLGLAPSSKHIASATFVASSAPYWKRWPRLADGLKIRVNAGFILPLMSKLYSPFPAHKFGLGNQNLPSAAVQQWASWMRKPDYLFDPEFGLDHSGFKTLTAPVLSFSMRDDLLAPIENVNHLLKFYPAAECTTQRVSPADLNVKHIGHTGLFKDKFKDSLWRRITDFIKQAAAAKNELSVTTDVSSEIASTTASTANPGNAENEATA